MCERTSTLCEEMTERYDSATAKHYAAYRPPLHRLILERAINSSESFKSGLDFGCGTGYSAFALTEFCNRVCGVDMSQQMLDLAEPHSRITYAPGTIESLGSLPGRPYDIATFAGSLFYVKSEALRRALISACSPGGTVIIYDFRVLTDELMEHVDAAALPDPSEYDYDVGLSKWDEFKAIAIEFDRVGIQVSPQEAAHFLLSDSFRYDALQGILGRQDVFESLVSRFQQRMGAINLRADIWCKRYRLDREDGNTQQVGAGNA